VAQVGVSKSSAALSNCYLHDTRNDLTLETCTYQRMANLTDTYKSKNGTAKKIDEGCTMKFEMKELCGVDIQLDAPVCRHSHIASVSW
jgi:hypothetical protein